MVILAPLFSRMWCTTVTVIISIQQLHTALSAMYQSYSLVRGTWLRSMTNTEGNIHSLMAQKLMVLQNLQPLNLYVKLTLLCTLMAYYRSFWYPTYFTLNCKSWSYLQNLVWMGLLWQTVVYVYVVHVIYSISVSLGHQEVGHRTAYPEQLIYSTVCKLRKIVRHSLIVSVW